MDTRLLDLLVCPICKGPLDHWRPPHQERQELVCHADKLAFPVRDGIPVMLESEARPIDNEPPAPPVFPIPPATESTPPR
ncbi:MAG: Trm112 family protein [Burkholderiaceae bacterium]|nr:Trm112 family protein [Burkholderiaceae bacterium]